MKVGDNISVIFEDGHFLKDIIGPHQLGVVTKRHDTILEFAITNEKRYIIDLEDENYHLIVLRDNQEYFQNNSIKPKIPVNVCYKYMSDNFSHTGYGNVYFVNNKGTIFEKGITVYVDNPYYYIREKIIKRINGGKEQKIESCKG